MRTVFFLLSTALLFSCSWETERSVKPSSSGSILSSVSQSQTQLQSTTVQLEGNGIQINLNTQASFQEGNTSSSVFSMIWSSPSISISSESAVSYIGLSTTDSIQNAVQQRGCDHIAELEQKVKVNPHDSDLFVALDNLQLQCTGIQSLENFNDESISLSNRQPFFWRKWVINDRAGSHVQLSLISFHGIPYYVVTELFGGDCAWARRYETFVDKTKVTIELNTGIVSPCRRISDEVIDKIFSNLHVSISPSPK